MSNPFELRHGGHHTLGSFEGLRGIAVLLVFFVHDVSLTARWLEPTSDMHWFVMWLMNMGQSGVDLFFILSGVLIYGSLIRKPQSLVVYAARRVERIYPTFLAVLAIYFVVFLAIPSVSKIDWQAPGNAVYIIQNLLLMPGIFDISPIIAMSWSLSYEMFFYISVPVLIALFTMRRWPPSMRRLFFLALGITCCLLDDLNSLQRVALFCSGVIVADLDAPKHPLWKWAGVAALIASAPLAVWVGGQTTMGGRYAVLAVLQGIAVWVCLHEFGALARAMHWSPLRWLGNMSYSFYLIHGVALQATMLVLSKTALPQLGALGWFIQAPIGLLAALVAAAAVYLCVERPISLLPAARGRGFAAWVRQRTQTLKV